MNRFAKGDRVRLTEEYYQHFPRARRREGVVSFQSRDSSEVAIRWPGRKCDDRVLTLFVELAPAADQQVEPASTG